MSELIVEVPSIATQHQVQEFVRTHFSQGRWRDYSRASARSAVAAYLGCRIGDWGGIYDPFGSAGSAFSKHAISATRKLVEEFRSGRATRVAVQAMPGTGKSHFARVLEQFGVVVVDTDLLSVLDGIAPSSDDESRVAYRLQESLPKHGVVITNRVGNHITSVCQRWADYHVAVMRRSPEEMRLILNERDGDAPNLATLWDWTIDFFSKFMPLAGTRMTLSVLRKGQYVSDILDPWYMVGESSSRAHPSSQLPGRVNSEKLPNPNLDWRPTAQVGRSASTTGR